MPVTCPVALRVLTPEEFTEFDYRVMPLLFASQNELGRLCDERIYAADLAARLTAAGFAPVRTEVPVTVTHRDFAKTYLLDLTVNDCALYELKAATALLGEHRAQTLNYVLLLGLRSAKLVNFRTGRLTSEYVSTRLTPDVRRSVEVDLRRWRPLSDRCALLKRTLLEVLADWGAFLELSLYQDALVHFLGGEAVVWHRVELTRAGISLGQQQLALLSPEVMTRFTAISEDISAAEVNLRRFLQLTPLRAMQWVNLNRAAVQFVTLERTR